MANPVLYYDAGQEATLILETDYRDGYGGMLDPISAQVIGVFLPDMTAMSGFPIDMTPITGETGIWYAKFWLPTGLTSVGTYLAIVNWVDPIDHYARKQTYSIVVGVPFGNASAVGV